MVAVKVSSSAARRKNTGQKKDVQNGDADANFSMRTISSLKVA